MSFPIPTTDSTPTDRRVQVAFAQSWQALVETHCTEAVPFVEALAPLVSVDEALDAYFREVPVPLGMRDAVRTGTFLRLDFAALDTPRLDGTPQGWALLHPMTILGVTRRMALTTQEARRRMTLATARALEGLAATHRRNAMAVAALFPGASEEGVHAYIKAMDLPTHAAQMVYQQALAELATTELKEAPAASPVPEVQPAPTRIPFLKVWARAS